PRASTGARGRRSGTGGAARRERSITTMSDRKGETADAIRLEGLWSGSFGDEYLARNANAGEGRGPFWTELLARVAVRTVRAAGVLIHQPAATLPRVMGEVVRTARRYVLAIEYFAAETEEIAYRGERGALFRRDYGRLYLEAFPELQLMDQGRLGREAGWDDV